MRDDLRSKTSMNPTTIVIFGSTGDLMHEKLVPAIHALFKHGNIDKNSKVLAVGRKDYDTKSYIENTRKRLKNTDSMDHLVPHLRYVKVDLYDDTSYASLKQYETDGHDLIFYLAVPPKLFPIIAKGLHTSNIMEKGNLKHRIIFEKPYGENLENARRINQEIWQYFDESQIYRIDHYLGKEMMQTLLSVRFANKIFEHIWDRASIDTVTIVAKESVGVKDRGPYYDSIGALKDMVQSHLLQMAALVAIDEPKDLSAEAIRDEKIKVLKEISIDPNSIVMGQYDGYLDESGVSKDSKTETAVYFKACLNTKRFLDVPFYFITGKKLTEKRSEIIIKFKHHAQESKLYQGLSLETNELRIKVAPEEGATIQFNVKKPGLESSIIPKNFDYVHASEAVGNVVEAYEKLIHEVILSRPTLFTRWDEIETSWKIIDEIKSKSKDPKSYHDSESFEKLLEAHRLEVGHDIRCLYDH
jgi:glucose-6-phosphate 1-dehydrogenase